MLKIAKPSLFELPIVVALSMIASQDSGGSGADFFWRFQFACGYSTLERIKFFTHSLLRFLPLCALITHPLI